MDGQNQKYINCVDRLHVITAAARQAGVLAVRARAAAAASDIRERPETKEAIYKQQSGRGILIDFFSLPGLRRRDRLIGPSVRPSVWNGNGKPPKFHLIIITQGKVHHSDAIDGAQATQARRPEGGLTHLRVVLRGYRIPPPTELKVPNGFVVCRYSDRRCVKVPEIQVVSVHKVSITFQKLLKSGGIF